MFTMNLHVCSIARTGTSSCNETCLLTHPRPLSCSITGYALMAFIVPTASAEQWQLTLVGGFMQSHDTWALL